MQAFNRNPKSSPRFSIERIEVFPLEAVFSVWNFLNPETLSQ